MEIISLEELLEEAYDDAVIETLEDSVNLQEVAYDVLLDMMENEGTTHSDLAFAKYIIERYIDVLNGVLDDHFDIEYIDEDVCVCDCDNCPCCELEID